MRAALTAGLVVVVGLASVIAAVSLGRQRRDAERPRVPVLAELFTSEGCSSCPPADDLLRRLLDDQPIDGVEVIGLSEHVDYWDRLGWKDRFSSPRFSARQRAYAQALRTSQIYTPQLVVDGRVEVVGSDWPAVQRALAESAKTQRAAVTVSGSRSGDGSAASVRVTVRNVPAATAKGGALVVVGIAENDLATNVGRGENARKRLRHAAVTRTLEIIGRLEPAATSGEFTRQVDLDPGWRRDRLRIVAFVQDAATRGVAGAASAGLTP